MKPFNLRRRSVRAALATALLGVAGVALAAPSYRALPDPVVVGTSFTMFLSDDAVDPATGFGSFDVAVNFDHSLLTRPFAAEAGSAFGDVDVAVSYDVIGAGGFGTADGIEDQGWARYTITRRADSRATSFGTDLLRLDFTLIGLPSAGSSADINYILAGMSGPAPYGLEGVPASSPSSYLARVGTLAFLPEPSTAALMLAALGLLCTTRRGAARGAGPAAAGSAPAAA